MTNRAKNVESSLQKAAGRASLLLTNAMNTCETDPKAALQEVRDYDAMMERGECIQIPAATQCHAAFSIYVGAVAQARLDPSLNPTKMFRKADKIFEECADRPLAAHNMLHISKLLESNLYLEDMMQILLRSMAIFDSPNIVKVSSDIFESYPREQAHSDRDFVTLMRAFNMLRLARAHRLRGQFDATFRYFYRSLQSFKLVESVQAHNFRILLKIDAMKLCSSLGLDVRANELFADVRSLARESPHPHTQNMLKIHELQLQARTLDPETFERRYQELCDDDWESRLPTFTNSMLSARISHCMARELWEEADQAVKQALENCELPQRAYARANNSVLAGKIRLKLNDSSGAITHADEVIQIARNMNNLYLEMKAHEVLARAFMLQNNSQAAYTALSRHLELKQQTLGTHITHQIADAENEYKNGSLREELRRLKFQNDILQGELQRTAQTEQSDKPARDTTSRHSTYATNGDLANGSTTATDGRQSTLKPDWQTFNKQFNADFPGFNSRMLDACPELTETECKICAMCRAGLSVKETAEILCVAENSVLKNRWRIRRKLKLQRSVKLSIYLRSV